MTVLSAGVCGTGQSKPSVVLTLDVWLMERESDLAGSPGFCSLVKVCRCIVWNRPAFLFHLLSNAALTLRELFSPQSCAGSETPGCSFLTFLNYHLPAEMTAVKEAGAC